VPFFIFVVRNKPEDLGFPAVQEDSKLIGIKEDETLDLNAIKWVFVE